MAAPYFEDIHTKAGVSVVLLLLRRGGASLVIEEGYLPLCGLFDLDLLHQKKKKLLRW